MSFTKLHEERSVYRVGNTQKYQVHVYCTDRGNLPDVGIFVYQIVDPADPLRDVFVRIAEIVDFSAAFGYLPNRQQAAQHGSEYWRSNVLVKEYDDIDVANAAVAAIFDRVNKLTNDYETYTNKFVTSGEDIGFPTATASVVESYKAAYQTAYTAYEKAQTAESDAQDALTKTEASLTAAETELRYWQEMRTRFEQESVNDKKTITDAHSSFNSFTLSAEQVVGAIDAFLFSYRGKFGAETRKVTMSSTDYIDCVASDVGKNVIQEGSGDTGKLTAFSNETRTWWILPDAGSDFTSSGRISVQGGTGKGYPTSSILIGAGPLDAEVSALQTARNTFDASRWQAVEAVAAASDGVTHHGLTSSFIGARNTEHSANVTQLQSDVADAQTAYNKAQGDLKTAYDNLVQAYNNVKTVCPDWSPTPPFPPVPA